MKEQHDEFESYKKSIRDADFALWISNLRESRWSIYHHDFNHVHIQYGREGSGSIAHGHTRFDGWVAFFQPSGERATANGTLLHEQAAFVIAPGDHFTLATPDSHEWFSIFVPTVLLVESHQDFDELMENGDESRIVLMTEKLNREALQIGKKITRRKGGRAGQLQEVVLAFMRRLLTQPGAHRHRRGRRSLRDHRDTLTMVLKAIEASECMNPSLNELVEAAMVSERTLRNVVGSYFGISPIKLVILRRLHEARRLLREQSGARQTVREVGAQLGFTDLGRFAGRYRLLFGENPSETLERSQLPRDH